MSGRKEKGKSIDLTPTEYRILLYLAKNIGRVASSSRLLGQAVERSITNSDAQEILKVHIRHLRSKIEEDPRNPCYLLNCRGFGYRLVP